MRKGVFSLFFPRIRSFERLILSSGISFNCCFSAIRQHQNLKRHSWLMDGTINKPCWMFIGLSKAKYWGLVKVEDMLYSILVIGSGLLKDNSYSLLAIVTVGITPFRKKQFPPAIHEPMNMFARFSTLWFWAFCGSEQLLIPGNPNRPAIITPWGSMYGIFTYISHKNQPNVGKYTIHGSYGTG